MRGAISIPAGQRLPFVSATGEAGAPGSVAKSAAPPDDASEEDVVAYLFDLLVGARRLAVSRKHRFLAYLIGMAVEEARLLTIGRSAAAPRSE